MTADFQTSDWEPGEMGGGHYSKTARLPKVLQLKAVAKNSGKGAAFAAGWPATNAGRYEYWSGEVIFYGDGEFRARYVNLVFGSGGEDARLVELGDGFAGRPDDLDSSYPVVCRP
jgi:hypothetical protein